MQAGDQEMLHLDIIQFLKIYHNLIFNRDPVPPQRSPMAYFYCSMCMCVYDIEGVYLEIT